MTGEAYDHLMAIMILGVLFTAAVFIVPTLSYVNLLYLDQQQLRNIALSALKAIIFDEGYPTNWGSMHGLNMFQENDLKRFGLALLSDPSLYVLDTDKVQRLASNNPLGSISYTKMKELLGLSGYDFSIILRPQFKVDKYVSRSALHSNTVTVTFNVNVSRNDGHPIPNAMVYGTIIYTVMESAGKDKFETRVINLEKKFTNSLGRCNATVQISAPSGWDVMDLAVIFKVTVADRATLVISDQSLPRPSDAAKVSLVGDNIIATLDESLPGSKDARWFTDITMYNFETSINLYTRGSPWGDPDLQGGKRDIWNQTFSGLSYSDPAILIFTVRTEPFGPGGRTFVLLIGPFSMWSQGGIIEFNLVSPSSGASVSVQRDVIIAGMAYIAELRLWKT